MNTVGTSQEGASVSTIEQLALMSKMTGADIHRRAGEHHRLVASIARAKAYLAPHDSLAATLKCGVMHGEEML